MGVNRLLAAAKFQVEYYFGQSNYHKDDYLRAMEDSDGWILISDICQFPKMKKFNLTKEEVYTIMKLSTVVDVIEEDRWGDGNMVYYIRKRGDTYRDEYAGIFGFNIETIK